MGREGAGGGEEGREGNTMNSEVAQGHAARRLPRTPISWGHYAWSILSPIFNSSPGFDHPNTPRIVSLLAFFPLFGKTALSALSHPNSLSEFY